MNGLGIDIGNTKVQFQLRDKEHTLLARLTIPTFYFDSHIAVIEYGFTWAMGRLRRDPDFVGIGFGCPVDTKTGFAKLTLATHLMGSVTTDQVRASSTPKRRGGVGPCFALSVFYARPYAIERCALRW